MTERDTMTDLADVLTPPDDPDAPLSSRINAQWAMAEYRRLTDEIDDVKTEAVKLRADIDAWELGEVERIEEAREFRRMQLVAWGLARRDEADGKETTFPLAAGVVKTTAVPQTVRITDQKAVDAWAAKQGFVELFNAPKPSAAEVLVTKLEKVAEVKAGGFGLGAFVEGERVPGVEVVAPHVKATIKVTHPEVAEDDPIATRTEVVEEVEAAG